MFDGARNLDDLGLQPLHLDRLELGMLDIQPRRRSSWPELAMRRINRSFWLLFWAFLGFAITGTIWVQS